MNILVNTFTTAGNRTENICISNFCKLTGGEAAVIRREINACLHKDHDTVYINAKDVTEADLSGINEIIHCNYSLQKLAKKLVFVYRKNSVVEKWVVATALDTFIDTAIITAN